MKRINTQLLYRERQNKCLLFTARGNVIIDVGPKVPLPHYRMHKVLKVVWLPRITSRRHLTSIEGGFRLNAKSMLLIGPLDTNQTNRTVI